jgi:hypothetical protein
MPLAWMLQNVSQDRGDSIKAPFYQRCQGAGCLGVSSKCVCGEAMRECVCTGSGDFEAHQTHHQSTQVVYVPYRPSTTEKGQKARRIGTDD